MRLATSIDTDQPIDEVVAAAKDARDAGFARVWSSQIFGADALTVLAVVAREVDGIEIATGVVPVHPRHPQVLAQQALTVQAISKGRLTLGIGLSHRVVVEELWGYDYDRGASYMRDYLSALLPMLRRETIDVHGERLRARTFGPIGVEVPSPPSVLLAALGPVMLRLAGSVADGTATWMTGVATLRDYIVPTIRKAAADAGRGEPTVVASLPVCVTADRSAVAARIDEALAIYTTLPSYKAMLDREGAATASDVALLGSRSEVLDGLRALEDAGVSEASLAIFGDRDEREATRGAVADYLSISGGSASA